MKQKEGPELGSEPYAAPVVEQELVIRPDGRIEVSWITPVATRLVMEVFKAVSDEPFPVRVLEGDIYCG